MPDVPQNRVKKVFINKSNPIFLIKKRVTQKTNFSKKRPQKQKKTQENAMQNKVHDQGKTFS